MASNFGRSMLEKYGWTHGKGLGREEDGVVDPITVRKNFNGYGLQHDVAKEFKSQWWDHVYNKTTSNLSVSTSQDGDVKVDRKGEFELSQKDVSFVRPQYYSSFVKAGTLNKLPEEKDMSMKLSYDDLFKICGGKTVHKGARHGIKMTAKLERVKQQEQELLDRWRNSSNKETNENKERELSSGNGKHSLFAIEQIQVSGMSGKSKKKKRSKRDLKDMYDVALRSHIVEIAQLDSDISKKHKKNVEQKVVELDSERYISDVICSDQGLKLKPNKKERKVVKLNSTSDAYEQIDPLQKTNETSNDVGSSKRKKDGKKLFKLNGTLENNQHVKPSQEENSNDSEVWNISKKEKKLLKLNNYSTDHEQENPVNERSDEGTVRKSKKKKSVDLEKEAEVEGFVATQGLGKAHKRKKKKSNDIDKESIIEVTVANDIEMENINKQKKKKRSKGTEKDEIEVVSVTENPEVENTVNKHKKKKKKSKCTEKEKDIESLVVTEWFENVDTSNTKGKKKKREDRDVVK